MLEVKLSLDGSSIALADLAAVLVSHIGAGGAVSQIGDLIELLIDQTDAILGDPDLEGEPDDWNVEDEGEQDVITWALPRYGVNQCRPALNAKAIQQEELRREEERELPAFIAEICHFRAGRLV